MTSYPLRRLSDGLVLDLKPSQVESHREYQIAGVFSFGRGLFRRGSIGGTETSYKSLNRLAKGQMVLSRLKAFEGAVATVPADFDGWYLSPEFPTFSCLTEVLDTNYLAHVCRWPDFWSRLAAGSQGLGNRRERVHAEALLKIEIPMPPIDEQRIIAARLDQAAGVVQRTLALGQGSCQISEVATDRAVQSVIDRGEAAGWPMRALGEIAEINPAPDRVDPDRSYPFVPMAAVDERSGSIRPVDMRTAREVSVGYKQFRHGDVIFARITPCMQNGKAAIFNIGTHGFGSTEFHVLRPGPLVSSEWLHRLVRTREFRDSAAERFTGTAGQQRVPAEFLRRVHVPIPQLADQQSAIRSIDRLLGLGLQLRGRRDHALLVGKALMPSILNDTFGGSA